jgi:methionyl-tRNA formyltransferase
MAEAGESNKLRIVFMGTPEFAAKILGALPEWPGGEVVGVFTQPDRPCGRGQTCKPSEVKILAEERGLPVFQPENFKKPENVRLIENLCPDLLVVAAYGLILPKSVLNVPRLGAWNVHASLLPKYRGAAPIQRAIMNGDFSTGITIMQMDEGMDTGDILLRRAVGIDIDETAGELHDQLADLGGRLLVEALERLEQGALKRMPQNDERATYAPKLTKAEGEIDWNRPAREVHNHIRGVTPWPGAYFHWLPRGAEKPLRITVAPGRVNGDKPTGAEPGEIIGLHDGGLAVATADQLYLVDQLKPEGKKKMDAGAFACGYLSRCEEES